MSAATVSPSDIATLQGRARRLRLQAQSLNPVVAEAYQRRAAELNLQAWLQAVWDPPVDDDFAPAPGGGLAPHRAA